MIVQRFYFSVSTLCFSLFGRSSSKKPFIKHSVRRYRLAIWSALLNLHLPVRHRHLRCLTRSTCLSSFQQFTRYILCLQLRTVLTTDDISDLLLHHKSGELMSSLDVLLQLGIIREFAAAVFDRTHKFLFGHIVEKHVDQTAWLLEFGHLLAIGIHHEAITVRTQSLETVLNIGQQLGIHVFVPGVHNVRKSLEPDGSQIKIIVGAMVQHLDNPSRHKFLICLPKWYTAYLKSSSTIRLLKIPKQ